MNGFGRDRWNYRGGTGPVTDTIDHPQGVPQRLAQPFYQTKILTAGNGTNIVLTGLVSGQYIFKNTDFGFNARSFVIDNPTQYVLLHIETLTQIPAGYLGFVVPMQPPMPTCNIMVLSGGNVDATLTLVVRASEQEGSPTGASGGTGGGAGASNTGSMNFVAPAVQSVGTTPSVLIIAARVNRWGCDVQNRDATNTLWIGPANTVAVNTGWPIGPGQDYPLRTQAAIWAIAQGAAINVAVVELF